MKTIVITGFTSGIGLAVYRALAAQGHTVIGIARSEAKCAEALAAVHTETPDAKASYYLADLSRLKDVREAAELIGKYLTDHHGGRLDALICNAGAVSSWYTTTQDGYETQFATNHLSGFLLTHHLMPYLINAGGKVLMTGSGSHKHARVDWDNIMSQGKRYSCLGAYKRSKFFNMLFAKEINSQFRDLGVRAFVVDPGLVNTGIGGKQTGGAVSWFWNLRRRSGVSPDDAAATYVYLCGVSPEGLYFYRNHARSYWRKADDDAAAQKLFEYSKRLCGIQNYGGCAV
jgi:NAD(P)-dependent dehydrogenase (short-subunit alcohol dehydrogenase family)